LLSLKGSKLEFPYIHTDNKFTKSSNIQFERDHFLADLGLEGDLACCDPVCAPDASPHHGEPVMGGRGCRQAILADLQVQVTVDCNTHTHTSHLVITKACNDEYGRNINVGL